MLAHKIDVSRERLPGWPSDKLTVLTEHSSVLYDIVPDQLMEQVCIKLLQACLVACPARVYAQSVLKS